MHYKTLDPQLYYAVDRAIGLGRDVAVSVDRLSPGRDSAEAGLIRRCLSSVADGHPFRDLDDGGLVTVRERLVAACRREECGRRRIFRGFCDPEGDDTGVVEEIPVYTKRGEELSGLLALFDTFLTVREIALELMRR